MKISYELDLDTFEAWSGAVETLNKVRAKSKTDTLEAVLEDMYPEGMSETELNDLLWFEQEKVYEWCGICPAIEDVDINITSHEEDVYEYGDIYVEGTVVITPEFGDEVEIEFEAGLDENGKQGDFSINWYGDEAYWIESYMEEDEDYIKEKIEDAIKGIKKEKTIKNGEGR